jgi:hypothetical protein
MRKRDTILIAGAALAAPAAAAALASETVI